MAAGNNIIPGVSKSGVTIFIWKNSPLKGNNGKKISAHLKNCSAVRVYELYTMNKHRV
jgi:hypothetical protein